MMLVRAAHPAEFPAHKVFLRAICADALKANGA